MTARTHVCRKWVSALRLVAWSVREAGTRAVLAIAGVAAGISGLTVTLALAAGARVALEAATEQAGSDVLTITAGRVDAPPGRGVSWYPSTKLDLDDVAALRAAEASIQTVVPIADRALPVKSEGRSALTSVRGVEPPYFAVRRFAVERGRWTDELDGAARSRVAVLGAVVAAKLGAGRSLVGDRVWIAGVPFDVIGELAPKGVGPDSPNEDDQVLVPLETAVRRLFNAEYLAGMLLALDDPESFAVVEQSARGVLRETHGLDPAVGDDFEILLPRRAERNRREQSTLMQRVATVVTGVVLAIGGAGVLIVSYLNVIDRTAEIGLRRAIGARRIDIAALFIAEAACLSAAGGVVGLAAGWLGVAGLRLATDWAMSVDIGAAIVSFAVAILLGFGASVGPAIRAARLMPVEGLSYA